MYKINVIVIITCIEPAQLLLRISYIKTGGINITWYSGSEINAQIFSLTMSFGFSSQVITLNGSYYYFIAPEGAPPCQVYNFSVAATYNIPGASYTGAGCSVPSPVLSTILPSLPDIDQIESSLSYLLTKQSNGSLALQVLLSVS